MRAKRATCCLTSVRQIVQTLTLFVSCFFLFTFFHICLQICLVLILFRYRLQYKDSEYPQPWSDPAVKVLLSFITRPLQQRPWDQLLVFLLCPTWDCRSGSLSGQHSHSLPTVKNAPPRPHQHPPRPHPIADLLPSPHKSTVPLCSRMPPVVQPCMGSKTVERHSANGRAAPCRPCHQGPDTPAVPGHPKCVSDPGDGGGEWLQEAHWPGAACSGSMLPGTTSPGGCWLL